jgi:hypothetical protein
VNSSAPVAPGIAFEDYPEAVDKLIARVLGRAHRTAEALNAANDARAILHVAQSFADELASVDPDFDPVQFIKEVRDETVR